MKKRIIARLDVKGPNVIKGIQFECLRVMGKPRELAENYYLQGADELIYLDIVANLYRRENLVKIVNEASERVFIPFTIGGGIRSVEDIRILLKAGADKVAINTAATKNPELIREASKTFGSQCIVSSIEAKKVGEGKWEPYVDNGRQRTGLDVVEWAKKIEELGAGEILLTSIDLDGTERGFDMELLEAVTKTVSIPVIAGGGAGSDEDIVECIKELDVDAVATGTLLHYHKQGVKEIKDSLKKSGIPVREVKGAVEVETNSDDYDIVDYNKYLTRQLKDEAENEYQYTDQEEIKEWDIGVIDYEINNVKSVIKAFEKIGKKAKVVRTPEGLEASKALVLPGVGAFEHGMKHIREQGLLEPIRRMATEGKPFLGICLGMQMIFSESEEFGLHEGLDLIKGRVVSLKQPSETNLKGYKLPHIGWNELDKEKTWDDSLLKSTGEKDLVYFVHSFVAKPENKDDILATTNYGNQSFCVVVKKDNVSGTQFHPEKSGMIGLNILKEFCEENNL